MEPISWKPRRLLRSLLLYSIIPLLAVPGLLCSAAEKKLCLMMIVKNEGKTILRCLESVRDVVDCICICDTGSTDDTISIIENFLSTHQIPGTVHRHQWRNFGHNRTLSAQAALETIKAIGWSANDTYLLSLDADMILNVNPQFQKERLTSDCYLIAQTSTALRYYNLRLFRASLPWLCLGPTHEYWSCALAHSEDTLDSLSVFDFADGGCRQDKLPRDLALLTAALQEDPLNSRYLFYLAQTYAILGQHEQAIQSYKARIDQKGWIEEVWYSMYGIGMAYEAQKKWADALMWYLRAYQTLPSRAEPLAQIALYYCAEGDFHAAYLFASQGARIPYPTGHTLFVSLPVYDYLFDEIISIAAFYTPYRAEGHRAIKKLLSNANLPVRTRALAQSNLRFYEEPVTTE